jgi:hypothetical protein
MLNSNGLSKLERGLELYVSGNEAGLRNLKRMKQSFEALARPQAHGDISVPLLPPYFRNLLEVVARCVRRPNAAAKMARRAEWLVIGQIIGNLGTPPWKLTDDDLIGSKLLGDVAKFMVQASGLKISFLDTYLNLLQDLRTDYSDSGILGVELGASVKHQVQEEEPLQSHMGLEQLDLSDHEDNNTSADSGPSNEQL